jgi:predicted lipoprotein with Yx(FWY)xxD motif
MQALRRLSLSVALPATLLFIPAATSQAAPHLTPPPALVKVVHDATLGQILVKANGRTLYHFSRDRNGKIGCTGACTQFWFPLLVAKGTKIATVAPGIRTGIGVINRGAGQIQVTYRSQPLYTFIGDQQAGQTNGQGFKDFGGVWTVATLKAPSSPASRSGGPGGHGRS